MLQVKLIRTSARSLEGEINTFLQDIGSRPGYRVSVPDIKITRIGGQQDLEEAMIIYNIVKVEMPATQPPTKR